MRNGALSLRLLGRDGATRGKVVKGGSNTSSRTNSKVRKDALLLRKLTSSLEELTLRVGLL